MVKWFWSVGGQNIVLKNSQTYFLGMVQFIQICHAMFFFASLNFCGRVLDWFAGWRLPMWHPWSKVSNENSQSLIQYEMLISGHIFFGWKSAQLTFAISRLSMMLDCILMAAGIPELSLLGFQLRIALCYLRLKNHLLFVSRQNVVHAWFHQC